MRACGTGTDGLQASGRMSWHVREHRIEELYQASDRGWDVLSSQGWSATRVAHVAHVNKRRACSWNGTDQRPRIDIVSQCAHREPFHAWILKRSEQEAPSISPFLAHVVHVPG